MSTATKRRIAGSEALFRSLVQRSSDVALVCDARGLITYASPSVQSFGYAEDQVVGRSGFDFVHPEDLPGAHAALQAALDSPGAHPPVVIRVRRADGEYRWAENSITTLLDDPAVRGLVLNLRDVTDSREALEALRESEQRFRTLVETSDEGIWLLDPALQILFVNARGALMLGYSERELVGRSLLELVVPDDIDVVHLGAQRRAQGHCDRYELRMVRQDGELIWVAVSAAPARDRDGRIVGSHAMCTDITERKRLDAELARLALHDGLTELPNRTLLADRLERGLARAQRAGHELAVLCLDVHRLSQINKTYGRAAGDVLLRAVAARLSAVAGPGDTVARLASDEFVIVLDETSGGEEQALAFAARVHDALAEPIRLDGHREEVSVSIGVVLSPPYDATALLAAAELAHQQAKVLGPGQTVTLDPAAAAAPGSAAQRVGAELAGALDTGGLRLHYQPIVDLATGRAAGLEALVRWQHPTRGLLGPDEFIPVAEATGLIHSLGDWVLREACATAAGWLREGAVPAEFTVAVNLSGRQLADANLPVTLSTVLAETGLPPEMLVIEVTETAVTNDIDVATDLLREIKRLGVRVALDDFGTGYSSLLYLRRFPVDRIKIDRVFVHGLDGGEAPADSDDAAIVASIVSLARAVGVTCVAEGVETAAQLDALVQLGCPNGQGFLWSPAVPADQVAEVLRVIAAADRRGRPTTPRRRARRPSDCLAPEIRNRILALHDSGASLHTIAAALNAEAVRTVRGTRWHAASVARVIQQESYPHLR